MKDKIIIAHTAVNNARIAFPTSSIIVISDENGDSKKSTVYLTTGKGYRVNENCYRLSEQLESNGDYIRVHGAKTNKERLILMDKVSHIEDNNKGSIIVFKSNVIEPFSVNEGIQQIMNQFN